MYIQLSILLFLFYYPISCDVPSEDVSISGENMIDTESYCLDPDTGSAHAVNTTWSSTTFCGNFTCHKRNKYMKQSDRNKLLNAKNKLIKLIIKDIKQINKSVALYNITEFGNALTHDELEVIKNLLQSIKGDDIVNLLDVSEAIKNLYTRVNYAALETQHPKYSKNIYKRLKSNFNAEFILIPTTYSKVGRDKQMSIESRSRVKKPTIENKSLEKLTGYLKNNRNRESIIDDKYKELTLDQRGRDKELTLDQRGRDKELTLDQRGRDKELTLDQRGRDKELTLDQRGRDKGLTIDKKGSDRKLIIDKVVGRGDSEMNFNLLDIKPYEEKKKGIKKPLDDNNVLTVDTKKGWINEVTTGSNYIIRKLAIDESENNKPTTFDSKQNVATLTDVNSKQNAVKQRVYDSQHNIAKQIAIDDKHTIVQLKSIDNKQNFAKQSSVDITQNIIKQKSLDNKQNVAKAISVDSKNNFAKQTVIDNKYNIAKQTSVESKHNVAGQTDINNKQIYSKQMPVNIKPITDKNPRVDKIPTEDNENFKYVYDHSAYDLRNSHKFLPSGYKYDLNRRIRNKPDWESINFEAPKTVSTPFISDYVESSIGLNSFVDTKTVKYPIVTLPVIVIDKPNIKDEWKSPPLRRSLIESVRSHTERNTERNTLKKLLEQRMKLKKIGKVIRLTDRIKRSLDHFIDTNNRVKRNNVILYTDDMDTYITSVRCPEDMEPGFYRAGDEDGVFPMCCPKRIEI